MHKQNVVHTLLAALAFLLTGAVPAETQNEVVYRWNTGAIRGEPLRAGSNVTVRLTDLNPLCYAYSIDAKPHLATVDLQKLIDLVNGTGVPAPAPKNAAPAESNPTIPADSEMSALFFGRSVALRNAVAEIDRLTNRAAEAVNRLDKDFDNAEAVVRLAEDPPCDGTSSLAASYGVWNALTTPDPLADIVQRISEARTAIRQAEASVAAALALAKTADDSAALGGNSEILSDASTTLDSLDERRAPLFQRMVRARAIMTSAVADGSEDTTQVFVPQGSDSLYLVVTRRELHPDSGKTAAVASQTAQLPVRNGMRFFLSVGALASAIKPNDYQRVTRQYADTTKGIYSTYSNVLRRRTLAFSPVLQGNVALRDVHSSGVSFLGSAGIAVRSVNGTNAPEFLTGVGLSFLDRFIWTGGVHLGRRERLLIGNPGEVEQGPVSDKVNESSAIGVEWRPALVTTFSVRLN